MENFTLLTLSTFIGGSIGFLFGGWTVSLTVLSIFMVVEILTRLIKHIHTKDKITSTLAYNQFFKKVALMLVIIIANAMDMLVGDGTPVFKSIAIMYYTGVEGLAIKEHINAIGLGIPKSISDKIENFTKEEK